jgi:hypothetical protein
VWGNGMRTHRPASYSAPAIGESSQWMLMSPSNGRWGSGRTILASTCASTLCSAVRKCKCVHVCEQVRGTEFCLESTRRGPARRRRRAREDVPRGSHGHRDVRSGRVLRRKILSLGLRVMAGASSSTARTLSAPDFNTVRPSLLLDSHTVRACAGPRSQSPDGVLPRRLPASR